MITRNRIYTKREPSRDAHKVYIVCEGRETEPNYFAFFEGLSSNLQVITIPPQNGTDPLKLMERAKEVFLADDAKYQIDYHDGDTVWFVIDTDTWEKEGKIGPLREFCNTMNRKITEKYDEVKPYEAWKVAQSNPCFELWLYYHFYKEKPDNDKVEKHETFKSFVNESINGGFDNGKDQVRLGEAIVNAKKNSTLNQQGKVALYSTEVHRLGTEILGFVKDDLAKLKNKL